MREELKQLYKVYEEEINKAQLWTLESEAGFIHWLLTGKLE